MFRSKRSSYSNSSYRKTMASLVGGGLNYKRATGEIKIHNGEVSTRCYTGRDWSISATVTGPGV